MSAIPTLPSLRAGSPSPSDPLVIESTAVYGIRLEHAAAGASDEPITLLAAVDLEGHLTISPLRVALAEPTRITIGWPTPLLVRSTDGADREMRLSAQARQAIHDALVRYLIDGDFGGRHS